MTLAALFALTACGSLPLTHSPTEQPTQPTQPAAIATSSAPTADPNLPVKSGAVIIGLLQEPDALSPLFANDSADKAISAFSVDAGFAIDSQNWWRKK